MNFFKKYFRELKKIANKNKKIILSLNYFVNKKI